MKKLCAIALLVLSIFTVKAQTSAQIEGLGRFKIGVTNVTVIDSLCAEFGVTLRKCFSTSACDEERNSVVEYGSDKVNCTAGNAYEPFSDDIRVFGIRDYNLMRKYKVFNLQLGFLRGTLYKIYAFNPMPNMYEPLKAEYGDSEKEAKEKDCSCKKFKCRFFTANWKSGDLKMLYSISETRDEGFTNCEKRIYSLVVVYSEEKVAEAKQINQKAFFNCGK